MSVTLDKKLLMKSALSAISIMLGVSVKNGYGHLHKNDPDSVSDGVLTASKIVGGALFVIGWGFMASSVLKANEDTNLLNKVGIVLSVLMILGGVAILKFGLSGGIWDVLMPILFVSGWIMLGITGGMGSNTSWALTIPAALLVITSMTMVIPLQRGKAIFNKSWTNPTNQIVDGPGYPMFALAWGLISLSNSLI